MLFQSAEVGSLLKNQESRNGVIAAICAAPVVLKTHGIALGKQVTSVPLHKDKLTSDYKYVEGQKVVTDGTIFLLSIIVTIFFSVNLKKTMYEIC